MKCAHFTCHVCKDVDLDTARAEAAALRAENERLREDLKKAQEKAAVYKRDWYEAKSEFGTAIAKLKADIAKARGEP